MQMYALDENLLILAPQAEKRKDYRCPECRSLVRLRAGEERSAHFYHLSKSSTCRLAQKGLIHLHLQHQIKKLFIDAEMEKPFPEINRIADVFAKDTVYEIQYSPMSIEEAKARTQDYESLGLQIIWILHDHTYNRKRPRPSERFFRTKPCYFSNHNERGEGMIYDQLPGTEKYPVNLAQKIPLPKKKWPEELHARSKTWAFYHEGDLFDKTPFTRQRKTNFLKKSYLGILENFLSPLIF